jgi:formylglycine-generating enzyme required for sulfatase activity
LSDEGTRLSSAKRNYSRTPSSRSLNIGFRVGFQAVQPDEANPELELFGGSAITREAGQAWAEPGVEAHDARDGNITDQIVVTGTVDMNSTGTYLLTFTVQDGAGNTATATRTVTVTGNRTVDLNATVAMDMIWCPPGTFTMGSPATEAGRGTDEMEHNVSLTHGFYLGKYEVTQAQYEAVMTGVTGDRNATPSNWHGNPDRPVEMVSWDDAQVFLTRLNEQQAGNLPAGWSCVLPTESQWEYACRAGTTTMYSWGNTIASSNANYNASGYTKTRDVGMYDPNSWGFFDMHGNVWEWTADWHQAAYPTGNPVVNPTGPGPASGSGRVRRGGSWNHGYTLLRSAQRQSRTPDTRSPATGFRVVFQKSQ